MKKHLPQRGLCTFALSLLTANAMAGDLVSMSNSMYANSGLFTTDQPATDSWRYSLGAGVVNMPTFPGASGTETNAVPLIGASYGRYFIGMNPDAGELLSLGAYLLRDDRWRIGAALAYDFIEPRKESDDPRLRGLGDIDRTAHAELFAIYSIGWAEIRGGVQTDIGGKDRGTSATLDAIGRYQATPELLLTAGPGLTWGSSDYNSTYFGVDEVQSALSGLPRYSAGSGLNTLRFSLGASYRLTTHWRVGGDITASWLQGGSADSPIVEKKTQMSYGVFVNYLF
jgi:MipA family protein